MTSQKIAISIMAACYILILSILWYHNSDDTYAVTTDDSECYSYRHGFWKSSKCFSTKQEAQEFMQGIITDSILEKEMKSRSWRDVK